LPPEVIGQEACPEDHSHSFASKRTIKVGVKKLWHRLAEFTQW